MMESIKQWFAAPVFEGDAEKTRHAGVIHTILIILQIYILLVIITILVNGRTPVQVLMIDFIGLFLTFFFQFWLKHGRVRLIGFTLLTSIFTFLTLANISLGTIRTPTTAAYLYVVVLASALFKRRGVFISITASSLAVLGLILAENAGLLPKPDYVVTLTQWIMYTGLFSITAVIVLLALESAQKAIEQARREIKERKHTEQALKDSQARLQALADSTIQSFILMDRDGNILFYNRAAAHSASILFGLKMRAGDPKTKFIINGTSLGFNDDFQKALQGKVVTSENFVQPPGQQAAWLSFTYTPVQNEDGSVAGVCLNVVDITESKNAEEKLHRQNEYLSNLHQITLDLLSRQKTQTLLNNIVQYAMLLVDAHHGYIFLPEGDSLVLSAATEGFVHHIGRREPKPGKGVLGRVWQSKEIFTVENYSKWEFRDPAYDHENLRAVAGIPVKTGSNIIGVLEVVSTNSPRIFTHEELKILTRFALLTALVLDNAQLLDSAEHEIAERKRKESILQTHVSEIEQLQMELREQALRDPLTGLYNRRYLGEAIEREILSAKRDNIPLSVIVTDIDHFKTINDTCGHQVGDTFLLAIANILKTNSRSSDIVCRFGGEEFLMVLPGTPLEAAVKRAEEIREKCMQIAISHEGKTLQATMSFGVATYPDHGWEAEEIIIKADKGLYKSKENGRNLVTVWNE